MMVGNLIKDRRKRKGWSQTVLGDLVGMSAATVHRIEHGEKIPTDQEALLIAGLLGIEHEKILLACTEAREQHVNVVPNQAYQASWDTAHPATYSGRVWIQVYPMPATRHLPHQYTLHWGVWQKTGVLEFKPEQPYLYLEHYKHNDGLGLPIFLTLSQSCYVVFGRGRVPEARLGVDIHDGWQRTEPPPPGQLWRYISGYSSWFIKRLLRRK